jgi:hypothetical protein
MKLDLNASSQEVLAGLVERLLAAEGRFVAPARGRVFVKSGSASYAPCSLSQRVASDHEASASARL